MSPTIQENDYVFSWSWQSMRYKKNDIVLINHPKYQLIIKRILNIRKDGFILFIGDNTRVSTDSEKIGWHNQTIIIGKVILHINQNKPIAIT